MKPSATFPTPYGVSVQVFDHPSEKGEFVFSMEATAICAGIHDPEARARFVADVTASGRCGMDRLQEYGGGCLVHIPLPRPSSPATPLIPTAGEVILPLEAWVTALMDVFRWCDRAEVLLEIIEGNFENARSFGRDFEPIFVPGLQIMMTGALEHLAEHEIDCLEAAAFYALSTHPEWSEPAIDWLSPMSSTWFKDWVAARPTYRRLAARCREDHDLPTWIDGGTQ